MLIYLVLSATLFISMLFYFEIARRYNIVDIPNQRSSHKGIVIRGGGVIFVLAVWIAMFYMQSIPYYFLGGITILAVTSFIDDRKGLSTKVRMLAHFSAIFLLLFQLQFVGLPIWVLPILAVLCVAMLNAYNFMDGINGINGMYSLSVLLAFFWLNLHLHFADDFLINLLICSILVFGFFNFRHKAACFSGDVGSISIAFALLFLLLSLIAHTQDWSFILLFLLYGIDAFWTVVQRYFNGEKITQAHRLHLYQLMSNELKMPHLLVSFMYFMVQTILSYVLIINHFEHYIPSWILALGLIVVTSLMYIVIKKQVIIYIKKLNE